MSQTTKKDFVVLLQGDSSGNENKYVKLFNAEGMNAKSISTLTFHFINQDKLLYCLSNPDIYNGIIFSSVRAVNAISSVLHTSSDLCMERWKNKKNFSVGKATADIAKSSLNLETYGSDSGNSEQFCQFIIKNYTLFDKPLLFPCSNIRKDTIPNTLSQSGFPVEEIVCYETVPNAQFETLWRNLILDEQGLPKILVFFSPSGVENCIETIKSSYSDGLPKFIALGPSTEKALLRVDISCKVAEKPTPESVIYAVKNIFDA